MIQAQASMTFHSFNCGALPVAVNISHFQGPGGVEEHYVTVRPTEYGSITTQLKWVLGAYQRALASFGVDYGTCVFRRFFCSDLINQASVLKVHAFANPDQPDEPCAVSWVCQPPAPPAKVALMAYHVSDCKGALDKANEGESLLLRRGELTHMWTTGITSTNSDANGHSLRGEHDSALQQARECSCHDSHGQTESILEKYESRLNSKRMHLADDVIRTWFFVRDVDTDYQGLVDARRNIFAQRGMTPDTHYLASTGIAGTSSDFAADVMMDAYAISGVRKEQIRYLSAPDHLSPTHVYGVTFERGVSVAYQDRKHIIISGTASIDSAGKIVYRDDVLQQLDRALENVSALLRSADAALRDVCTFIVYVRDPSDSEIAQQVMRERFGAAPVTVVVAPVCRPGWLIEIECQAIVPAANPTLPEF